MANGPSILIGDEPTGNLDSETAEAVFDLLVQLHNEGTTVIYVTHDQQLAARASRRIAVRDGRVVADAALLPAVSSVESVESAAQ